MLLPGFCPSSYGLSLVITLIIEYWHIKYSPWAFFYFVFAPKVVK